jgi:hypothetical protein
MILWELFHNAVPFDGDLSLAENYVVTEDARPKINEDVNDNIARVIRACWQKEPEKRP